MKREVIIALDFGSGDKALEFLDRFSETKPFVKIGMELFYGEGPQIVRDIKARGHKVFLDLKLHDIPNTVGKAMKSLSSLDVDIINVHAAGAIEMMQAAAAGFADCDKKPLVIAVTQLTSTDQQTMKNQLLIDYPMEEVVAKYAANAEAAGLAGVVCSPLEVPEVKALCGEEFVTVTPGVRFAGEGKGDQKRVTTPEQAAELGSDFIVMGRSITGAKDPEEAYVRAMREFGGEDNE